jgi:hypothetical protein
VTATTLAPPARNAKAADAEGRYWLTRPVAERVATMEQIRKRVKGTVELPNEWLEFLSLLQRHDAKFVIVGA